MEAVDLALRSWAAEIKGYILPFPSSKCRKGRASAVLKLLAANVDSYL